jgi:thiosulfate dehydrogenase
MYRLSRLASYVRNNMPPGASYKHPELINEDAWDVAAYLNSHPHPNIIFASDWPVLSSKPIDYPFGPYADGFSETQHKYGPYQEMIKK